MSSTRVFFKIKYANLCISENLQIDECRVYTNTMLNLSPDVK